MAFPGAGIGGDVGGGFGGGLGGFGFPGVGGGINLDVNGGAGLGGLGLLGGGLPGWTGFSGPYIPSTPLGALGGIKGDLIVPIVAVGVALFLLVLIVLAVKAALAWKIDLLSGGHRLKRDIGSAPAEHLEDDNMMEMARMVMAALYSDTCSKRVICEMGSYARSTKQLPAVLRLVESFMPADYIPSIEIMRNSAEGSLECERQFPCGTPNNGTDAKNASQQQDQSANKNATQEAAPSIPTQQPQQPQRRQLPIPLQVTPRPTLLEGIKISNQSAANKSESNEVRTNVHKPAKYRPTN